MEWCVCDGGITFAKSYTRRKKLTKGGIKDRDKSHF